MVPAPRVSLQRVSVVVVTPFIMLINGRINCAQPGRCLHIPDITIYHSIHRARAPAASPRLRAARRLCAVRGPWSVEKADCVVRRLGDKATRRALGTGNGEMLEYQNIRRSKCSTIHIISMYLQLTDERLLAVLTAAAACHRLSPRCLVTTPALLRPHFLPCRRQYLPIWKLFSVSLCKNGMNESSDLSKMWSS